MTEMLFFSGYDASGSYSLFVSDGTPGGTSEVTINGAYTGGGGLNPTGLVSLSGEVYFSGVDAAGNRNLWESNGTTAGTTELTIAGQSSNFGPSNLAVVGSALYFDGTDSGGNVGLWTSNGTAAITTELDSSEPSWSAYPIAEPHDFTALDGEVYFLAGSATVRILASCG